MQAIDKNRRIHHFNTHSVLLDGVDEFINTDAVQSALATTAAGAWSCLIKPVDATPSAIERIISFSDTDANSHIDLFAQTNGILEVICLNAGSVRWRVATNNAELADNTWLHFGLSVDGVNDPVIYINAIVVPQTTTTSTDVTVWFNDIAGLDNGRIGNLSQNGGGESGHFNGNMDEIRFWNVAKTAAEMLDDYNAGRPKIPNPTGLVAHFRIDGDAINTAKDGTTSNDGTYVNVEQADIELDVAA